MIITAKSCAAIQIPPLFAGGAPRLGPRPCAAYPPPGADMAKTDAIRLFFKAAGRRDAPEGRGGQRILLSHEAEDRGGGQQLERFELSRKGDGQFKGLHRGPVKGGELALEGDHRAVHREGGEGEGVGGAEPAGDGGEPAPGHGGKHRGVGAVDDRDGVFAGELPRQLAFLRTMNAAFSHAIW